MTLDAEVNDFIGIYANSADNMHLIKIVTPKKEEPEKERKLTTQDSWVGMSGVEQSGVE